MKAFTITLIFSLFFFEAMSKTAQEWRTRTVYQILTDRFARPDDDVTPCADLNNYCGGTFKGIEKNLDYLQEMGVDAIWISPVQSQTEGGYHGYWVKDFYKINEKFGTEQDFIDLVKACHERDIWVMVDIVANHIGYVTNDYSISVPFNDIKYFHSSDLQCEYVFQYQKDNQTAYELCWLNGLPDLDQDNSFVKNTLLEWINWFVKTYEIDGIRIDAIRHVNIKFWADFSKASNVFTIGESYHMEIDYNAAYQGSIDSVLNFPLHGKLWWAFQGNGPLTILEDYYIEANKGWVDFTVLGNFLGNHDLYRFLHKGNMQGFKAAYAFILCSVGIPIIYYGDEQSFNGGADPQNRESMWGYFNKEAEVYQYIKTINAFKKKAQFYQFDQIQRAADEFFYAFSRGEYFFAFTNNPEIQTRVITSHPYEEHTKLCNLFNVNDFVFVKDGKFEITLINEETKILFPLKNKDNESVGLKIWESIKAFWNNLAISDMSIVGKYN